MINETVAESGAVPSLFGGRTHEASCERSYNSDETVYCELGSLRAAWEEFRQESLDHDRRRAVMKCYVTPEVLSQASDLPIEAVVPLGDECLIWLGQNRHSSISPNRDTRQLPTPSDVALPAGFSLATNPRVEDVPSLTNLWQQFGWSEGGVRDHVVNNTNPIVLIRNPEQEAIGVMIAEAMEFGHRKLVELTELAVNPNYQSLGLATVLIRELANLSLVHFGPDSVFFGEYNLTTQSFRSAARANQLPGRNGNIDGILRDHVAIETGAGNAEVEPWDTRWLHNFLVMYQLAEETINER